MNDQRGMTLVEALTAAALLVLVTGAAISFYFSVNQIYLGYKQQSEFRSMVQLTETMIGRQFADAVGVYRPDANTLVYENLNGTFGRLEYDPANQQLTLYKLEQATSYYDGTKVRPVVLSNAATRFEVLMPDEDPLSYGSILSSGQQFSVALQFAGRKLNGDEQLTEISIPVTLFAH